MESLNLSIIKIIMQTILKIPGFTDNVLTHLLSGLGAGFFAVCIGSPVDVVLYILIYNYHYMLVFTHSLIYYTDRNFLWSVR